MTQFNLETQGSAFWLILLALLAIGLSWFVYRKTIPPVSTNWRVLLMSLRALAIIAIVLLLFEPILSLTRRKQEKPIVAVLVDNSASMGLVDEKVNRPEVLHKILSSETLQSPAGNYQFEYFPFSFALGDEQKSLPDSLAPDQDGTDLQRALAEVKEKLAENYFAAVVMVTDGADNLGENPARYARTFGVPVYTIGIGDPTEQKDAIITNFASNEVVYAESKAPVDVYVKSSGFDGTRVPVNLVHEGQIVDSQIVTLNGNGLEQKVRLHFTPTEEGLNKYEIRIPKLEGELTQNNNAKTFYAKVLKSRLKVTVVAGGPGSDLAFLKRTLRADENIEVTTFTEKQNGTFYENSTLPAADDLEKVDCFILVDYPRATSNNGELQKLKSVLAKGKPVLAIASQNLDYGKLAALQEFLPVEAPPARGPEQPVYIMVLPQGKHHPVMRISEDDLSNERSWQELPPIFTNLRSLKLRNGAQALAAVDLNRTPTARNRAIPLIAAYDSGQRKSLQFLVYGIWRWDLMMSGVGKGDGTYRQLLSNAIRWLTTQESSKLVRVTANKDIYRSGEEVEFTAQVYREDYQPVDNAEVAVQLKSENGTQELTLNNIGDGRYEGSFQVLQGGDYTFTGTAHEQSRVLGRDTGKFSVEAFSLEYQDTRMNEALLKNMAHESGGEFYTADDYRNLSNQLNFPERYITLNSEWEIWNRTPMLILCILLLGTEWFVRKRKGML